MSNKCGLLTNNASNVNSDPWAINTQPKYNDNKAKCGPNIALLGTVGQCCQADNYCYKISNNNKTGYCYSNFSLLAQDLRLKEYEQEKKSNNK